MKKLDEVDVVLVGLGWSGGILAKELAEAGLTVTAIERGGMRTTEKDFTVPNVRDELRYVSRNELMQSPEKETVTVRHDVSEEALPLRRLGSFLPGEGVGGAGVHWAGQSWRWTDMEFKIRSQYEGQYGKAFIPNDMPIQDWGITYSELEPYYEKFEYLAGVSGRAGNIKGEIRPGGNPYESSREKDYPLPPLQQGLSDILFDETTKRMGYHPFPRPTANASQSYKNPDGAEFGACQYCGYCERFGCESNAKGSPHFTVIPIALRHSNFKLHTNSWVTQINKDTNGKRVTGVNFTSTVTGEQFEQPARMVILCAFALNNVHLMLLSKIGEPYDPNTQKGLIGKNYSYQNFFGSNLFFEDKIFNPFMSTGGWGTAIDDFNLNWEFPRSKVGYVGGATIASHVISGRPIAYHPVPDGTPSWGSKWKSEVAKWYSRSMFIISSGSVMPNRWNFLDLDPSYRSSLGQPLLRMTFDYRENDHKLGNYISQIVNDIAHAMHPTVMNPAKPRFPWQVARYQSSHNTGGTIMGTKPDTSVVNRYLQSWECHNLFIMGASVFPHNSAYNPTALVAALSYRTADILKKKYISNPGPLV